MVSSSSQMNKNENFKLHPFSSVHFFELLFLNFLNEKYQIQIKMVFNYVHYGIQICVNSFQLTFFFILN